MRFSESWLREWVDPDVTTDGLAAQLTQAGLEVDAVEPVDPGLEGVVVGRVESVAPHPDADRLRVCRVDVGGEGLLDIVCGAPNVHAGMRAPTALVGATLPGGMTIRKAKLRGVASAGMLCSARELGLSEHAAGLMALPADAPPGQPVADLLGLADTAIEVDLTPNRGDCLGLAGLAREVGVLNRAPVRGPSAEPVPAVSEARFPVEVQAPGDCPRYVGRVIRDVDPAAHSPMWLQERLRRSGLRSLGALVDITNYVMLELGQPMHAFDLDRLAGAVVVRRARAGERLDLLDDTTVELDADTLVIADGNGPVAIAGIMGGSPTAVGPGTRNIFLESAFFAPEAVAGRARRLSRQTDSSHRFERGVDPGLQRRAVERATALVLAVAGGEPGPVVEVAAPDHLPERRPIRLRPDRIRRVLGLEIPDPEVVDTLERLGMEVTADGDDWRVVPPGFRFDVGIEEDLIEELARVVGYDRIPTTLPVGRLGAGSAPEGAVPLDQVRGLLVARGYQEAITYSFVDPRLQAQVEPERDAVTLENPLSADLSVMRTSLWPGLLAALQHNRNRQQERVRLFETGLRFEQLNGELRQEPMLAGIAAGASLPEQWGAPARPLDFFDVKGDLEAVLGLLGLKQAVGFAPARHPALHPGQTAALRWQDTEWGRVGALHPRLATALDLAGPVMLFELRLALLEHARIPRFEPLSRYPAIRRDIAVVVDDAVPARKVVEVIGQAGSDVLKDLQLFDVYRGERIDSGKKSLAVGLFLQAESRTLTDAEVDAAVGDIVAALESGLDARLRG